MEFNVYRISQLTCFRNTTPCLLQYANNNRNQGRFNDVTIVSGDTSIPANRMVLCCYCSFFDQLFASQLNDQVNNSVVNIPDVVGKSLELIVQYIYTGQICIDSDNVLDILATAHHLELEEVEQFCFKFLEVFLKPDDCITTLITAKKYENFDLRDKVYKYISDNYETITQTQAFLDLENVELFFIVYHLKTKFGVNDAVLCRSLLSWTKQDEEARKNQFQERLIKFVNVEELSYWLLKDLLNESLICSNFDFVSLLKCRKQVLQSSETKIISVGGLYTSTSMKNIYSLDDESAAVYSDLPIPLYAHKTIKLKNSVYCVTGKTVSSVANRVLALNLTDTDLQWKDRCALTNPRADAGVAVFNDSIVVCGGSNLDQYLSSTEVYNTKVDTWKQVSCLKQSKKGNQLATSGECLYSIGGNDGRSNLSSVERLDGLDQSWKIVSSMQASRSGFAAVSCDDVIYAIGGLNDKNEAMKSVEKYDCAADEWSYVSEMNIERYGHSACVMHGRIFVVGGRKFKRKFAKEIECYDPITDRWEIAKIIDDELVSQSLVVV